MDAMGGAPFCGPVGSRDLELPDSLGDVAVPDVTLAGRRIPGSGWFTECSARLWRCGSRLMLSAGMTGSARCPTVRQRLRPDPASAMGAPAGGRPAGGSARPAGSGPGRPASRRCSAFGIRRRRECPTSARERHTAVAVSGSRGRSVRGSTFPTHAQERFPARRARRREAARLGRPEPRLCSWVTHVP